MSPVHQQRLGSSVEMGSGEYERATTELSMISMTPSFLCLFSGWDIVVRSRTADIRDDGDMRSSGQHCTEVNDLGRI